MDSRLRGNDEQKQTPVPTRLGDVVNFKRGYDLPESARRPGPYPVISSAGISGYHDEFKVRGEGVVTGRYGTLGEMHYHNGAYWPHNTALYVTDFKGNVPKYVYYLLSCLGRMDTGDKSTVPGVNRNDLHELKIPVIGNKADQQKIAAVLSALDAKVDLNNRINAELEAQAKTLYDYWFVQFDFPDANGRPYKTSGGRMVWNEALKREIPAGWADLNITALAEVVGGATPSKANPEYWNGDIPFFTPTDAGGSVFQLQTEDSITQSGLDRCSSDLFDKGTILITARGSVGKIAITGRAMAMNQSCYALVPKVPASYPFVFLHAKTLIHHLKVKASGSTFNSIVTNDIEWTRLISPRPEVVSAFCKAVTPLFERIEAAQRENLELTQLRDWLLPLLMNGQVRVA
ncbi:restriction endonuclease subunit S [Luteimonas lutimaris]|uniref:Restriction endonuclease subunit S n=1 Tax=Luteimonas lutimaris TaxID=698645 RepID=A0ABP7MGZ5_9GAMM